VERSAGLPQPPMLRKTTTLPFVISTGAKRSGEICGSPPAADVAENHNPTLCHLDRSEAQWRDLRVSPSRRCCGKPQPYPLSSRPERSVVGRSAGLPQPPMLRKTTTLPFVISTGAKRSGEICGPAVPSWECFSTERNSLRNKLGRVLDTKHKSRARSHIQSVSRIN
jgi:hypothetical protein